MNTMKSGQKPAMFKNLTLVFIAILLLAFAATALHSHADISFHKNCPVCAASHLPAAASNYSFCAVHASTVVLAFPSEGPMVLPLTVSASFTPRAPPV